MSKAKSVVVDCEVCCNPLLKKVCCAKCNYDVCVSCTERFLLDLNANVQCMNCKQSWTREFMAGSFTKKFLDGPFKEHKKTLLLDIEKGLMPETQPWAEHSKLLREMHSKYVKDKDLLKELVNGKFRAQNIQFPRTIDDLREKAKLEKEYNNIKIDIRIYRDAKALNIIGGGQMNQPAQERRVFVKPCPAPDCRGFLSTQWNCGLCHTKVCSKCHEIKGDGEHTCDEDILKTVQLMAQDSKPCPKCGEMITRISGCPQMFHTPLSGGCGAIFDWNTLHISESGAGVHNPHWFEYQRQLNGGQVPRNPNDNGCGVMPHASTISQLVKRLTHGDNLEEIAITTRLLAIMRGHAHLMHVQLPRYRVNIVDENRDLRIRYLLDEISEDYLKMNIMKREKARDKAREYGQIIQMYLDAARDIIIRVSQSASRSTMVNTIAEMDSLIQYTDASFAKSQVLFKSTVTTFICPNRYYLAEKSKPKPKPKKKAATAADSSDDE